MTSRERTAYLSEGSGRKCIAYSAPPKSRLLPARAAAFVYRLARLPRWIALPLLALCSLSGCATVKHPPTAPAPTEDSKRFKESEDGKMYLGGIMAEERPLWKRILWPW